MKNFAWVIDQRKCIGCHACTTACKSENEVPLSVDRTWVKYVEKGTFPNAQRHFGVLRCNHCADPPCVHICPVSAMFQRKDGIVEFAKDVCIGCKACIAACPYDAIYIDPENGTAAKCNFCAHRIDVGLEPACVVVCPEEALIFGDINDPLSKVSQLIGREKTQVRKPEKNTDPKCFYIGADEAVLNPDVQSHDESGLYMWSSQREEKHGAHMDNNCSHHHSHSTDGYGRARLSDEAMGQMAGQVESGGASHNPYTRKPGGLSLATALNTVTNAKVAYDVHHGVPWGKEVSAYLWTKSISSGVFLMSWAFLTSQLKNPYYWSVDTTHTLGAVRLVTSALPMYGPDWTYWLAPILALGFLGLTGLLLVFDLDRPERFWTILVRPQWRSWLAIGSYIILAYSILLVALIAMYAAGMASSDIFTWVYNATVLPAVMTSIYTAFLFAQAKGRDLWQSPLFPFHLLVQAIMAGSATILIAGAFLQDTSNVRTVSANTLVVATVSHLLLISGEILVEHSSKAKARAMHMMTRGPYKTMFWGSGITFGGILPLSLIGISTFLHTPVLTDFLYPVAAAAVLFGLLAYEHCFVMAGQSVRLS